MLVKEFQMKLSNMFSKFLNKNNTNQKGDITEYSLGYNKVKVVYYRTVDSYLVYRCVMLNEEEHQSISCMDLNKYKNIKELEDYYKDNFESVELLNLLSVDYVYLYKSGMFVEGSDLRTRAQKLNDNIVHCLYSNGFMQEVLIHNKSLNCKFYKPYDGDYKEKNSEGWSLSLVDYYMGSDRIKLFVSSETLFNFNSISKSIIVNPIELLTELECTVVNSGYNASHCGDLGIQIN